MEIPKAYNPKDHEDRIYKEWEEGGFFNPEENITQGITSQEARTFTIVLPPPNATGTLHTGHAMYALEDLMIRFHRMLGDQTLWLPGTDHAAIATHVKVERLLKENEGLTRHDLGREKFLQRIHDYIAHSQETIHLQLRKMGFSLDWKREAYTLDEKRSLAVRTAFKKMYDAGLIVRGQRIVNWCIQCQSTLSDDEVLYREERAPFYYIKYGSIVIGTSRPETKFADKIIIFHPHDERYKGMDGKKVKISWLSGEIEATFVADEAADPTFGSGAMTITPAHDFLDFELAQKHGFEIIDIIRSDGTMTEVAGEFAGMPVHECREKLVEKMKQLGLIDHIDENYVHNLSVCYRCGTPIEPMVSKQWFVSVTKPFSFQQSKRHPIVGLIDGQNISLKELMRHAVENEQIKIIPDRFYKTYFHWINNLRDWCISRQIWFGHRVPVWYCKTETCEPIVSIENPTQCPVCNEKDLIQDSDTLDTWFSSGLWTFSTLGWPRENASDFLRFHPTQVLETGYDILPFWVARMILMTTFLLGEIPFETVYLHGLIRDEKGRKMSKSLGNIIDPMDVAEQYGTDALRLALILDSTAGNDKKLSGQKIEAYQHFVNKLWNISRYILTSVNEIKIQIKEPEAKTVWDEWILSRLSKITKEATGGLEKYEFARVGEVLYDFTWHDFADWYIEVAKIEKNKDEILLYVLQTLLKLWHPYMPFVTEAIWEFFSAPQKLIVTKWPLVQYVKPENQEIEIIKDIITSIRETRASFHIPWKQKLEFITPNAIAEKYSFVIHGLTNTSKIIISNEKPEQSISFPSGGYLKVGEFVDFPKEKERIQNEIENIEKYTLGLAGKLQNEAFLKNARPEIVEETQKKKQDADEKLILLKNQLEQLS